VIRLTNCIYCGETLVKAQRGLQYLFGVEIIDIPDVPIDNCPKCAKDYINSNSEAAMKNYLAKNRTDIKFREV